MAELRESTWKDLGLWLLRRRRRFRVTGASMTPTLQPGDELLLDPAAYRESTPQPDDLVVLRDPRDRGRKMVKRIRFMDENGRFYVTGDNPAASTDSRTFGAVPLDLIIGRVECCFGSHD